VKRLTRYTDATFERLAVAVMPDRFCKASCSNRSSLCVAIGVIAFALGVASAKAQEAEPRSYSNTPIGLNFLIGGYVYSKARWRSTRISRSPLRRHQQADGLVLAYRKPRGAAWLLRSVRMTDLSTTFLPVLKN
jgi:hypothetical protein